MENHYPEILGQFLGQQRDGGAENFDLTTKQAADICGGCQSASEAAQGPEPLSREERAAFAEKVKPLEEAALRQFAIQNHLWSNPIDFLNKYHDRFIGSGAGNLLFIDPVIYFETPDLKLGGKHVFRFPFDK